MNCTSVSTPHAVVNISERYIERIVFVLPGSNRDSSLVAPKNERNKHRPMRRGILGDYILCNIHSASQLQGISKTSNLLR